jgi:hypothetical protein
VPESSLAANAAASPIVDSFLELIDQGIDLVGEDAVAAMIAERIDIPFLTESMEVAALKFIVKQIHARIHKSPVTPTT